MSGAPLGGSFVNCPSEVEHQLCSFPSPKDTGMPQKCAGSPDAQASGAGGPFRTPTAQPNPQTHPPPLTHPSFSKSSSSGGCRQKPRAEETAGRHRLQPLLTRESVLGQLRTPIWRLREFRSCAADRLHQAGRGGGAGGVRALYFSKPLEHAVPGRLSWFSPQSRALASAAASPSRFRATGDGCRIVRKPTHPVAEKCGALS